MCTFAVDEDTLPETLPADRSARIFHTSEGKDVKIWDRLSGEMLREIYTTQSRGYVALHSSEHATSAGRPHFSM